MDSKHGSKHVYLQMSGERAGGQKEAIFMNQFANEAFLDLTDEGWSSVCMAHLERIECMPLPLATGVTGTS